MIILVVADRRLLGAGVAHHVAHLCGFKARLFQVSCVRVLELFLSDVLLGQLIMHLAKIRLASLPVRSTRSSFGTYSSLCKARTVLFQTKLAQDKLKMNSTPSTTRGHARDLGFCDGGDRDGDGDGNGGDGVGWQESHELASCLKGEDGEKPTKLSDFHHNLARTWHRRRTCRITRRSHKALTSPRTRRHGY